MNNGHSNLREFGRLRLDLERRLLWADGELLLLPPKAVELLCVLVESNGAVVTKDEIFEKVWQNAFVEETNLTHNIYLLRKAFKDLGENQFIKTIPRRGYSFSGDIREIPVGEVVLERHSLTQTTIEFQDDSCEVQPLVTANKNDRSLRGRVFSRARVLFVLGMGAVLIGGFFMFRNWSTSTRATASDIRSIAVLPVKSFSEGPDNEELRIRITDALITRLGHLERTAVRPTSAILPFAKSGQNALEIGKQLRADAVIDSRIQQEGDRLRVTVAKRPSENSDAYEAYLNGRYHWTKRDEADLRQAIEYFKTAIELDPNFSEAYTGLADSQNLLFNYNIDSRPEVVAEAKENLDRAREIKPDTADALTTLGSIQMVYDWDWKAAEESLKAATTAEPNMSIAHMRYGALLVRLGRIPESLAESQRSVELDPLSVASVTNLGLVYFCRKDFAAADAQYKKALEIGDTIGAAHWLFSRSLWLQGKKDDAIKELIRAIELDGNKALAEKLAAKAKTGSPEDVIRLLLFEWRDDPPGTNPPSNAYLAASIGDREKAMYWVERSVKERHAWTTWFYAAPEYESLRDIPRFQQILHEMNFVE